CSSDQKRIKAELEARKLTGTNRPAVTVSADAVDIHASQDPVIAEQLKHVAIQESKLLKTKANSLPAIAAQRDLETAKKAIEERRKQIAEGMAKTWEAKLRQEREMSNEQLEEKRLALAQWQQDLDAEVKDLEKKCSNINDSSLDIVSLREEI